MVIFSHGFASSCDTISALLGASEANDISSCWIGEFGIILWNLGFSKGISTFLCCRYLVFVLDESASCKLPNVLIMLV